MLITLKCRNCGKIQKVELDDLCKELFYMCANCETIMTDRESTKLANLATLDNFDVVKIIDGDSRSDFQNSIFTDDLERITEIYCGADNDFKREIANIVDAVYLILNKKNVEEAKVLHNMVRDYQLSKDTTMQADAEKSLFVKTEKSFEEFVSYIEEKIPGYGISKSGLAFLKNLFNKYDFDLLLECVDISYEKYLEYDEEGEIVKGSIGLFCNKIGGIAYNKSRSQIQDRIGYIVNYGDKVAYDWRKNDVKALLQRYVVTLKEYGYDEEEIVTDLQDHVITMISETRDWREWDEKVRDRMRMFAEEIE